MIDNTKTTVIGGGSWGTALAYKLVRKNIDTTLYIRSPEQIETIERTGKYERYLPGFVYPKEMHLENDFLKSISNSKYIVSAVPTNSSRDIFNKLKGHISQDVIIINVAKGIEVSTNMRISQICKEILPNNPFVALSGPTHAEEVVLDYPSSIVSTSKDLKIAEEVQNLFMSETFRVYTNDDLIGVEIAGALKNVIALGAGILVGLGFGDNSMSALMTRGINEIARLGIDQGAKVSTFFGLAGIGDLIVTCSSEHSRNRRCGEYIGQGYSVKEAIEKVGMVVEGIKTTDAAKKLFENSDVEMPLVNTLYDILHNGKSPKEATVDLMLRDKKHEMKGILDE